MALRSWAPLREMDEFRRSIDDMLDHLRGRIGYPLETRPRTQKAPIESFVEDGKLVVRAELAGVDPKEIAVNVVSDVLTISASREEERETKKRDFVHREFRYGVIERSMDLPRGVKAEDITASFSNGVLQLTIPVPEETAPKQVKVNVEHTESKSSGPKGPNA